MVTQQPRAYEGMIAETVYVPGHGGDTIGGYMLGLWGQALTRGRW